MKKLISLILSAVLLCAPALAAGATPNQDLYFRTGPNTRYASVGTFPQSTAITPLAYEEGNGVTWVLCEFMYRGQLCQGYTGLKRMSIHGNIPWATNGNGAICIREETPVYAAPSTSSVRRGWLYERELVLNLQSLTPCSDEFCEDCLIEMQNNYMYFPRGWAFVEYRDRTTGQLSRGWIDTYAMGAIGRGGCYLLEDSEIYSEDLRYTLGYLPENTIVSVVSVDGRYTCIEYSAGNGNIDRACILTQNLQLY